MKLLYITVRNENSIGKKTKVITETTRQRQWKSAHYLTEQAGAGACRFAHVYTTLQKPAQGTTRHLLKKTVPATVIPLQQARTLVALRTASPIPLPLRQDRRQPLRGTPREGTPSRAPALGPHAEMFRANTPRLGWWR